MTLLITIIAAIIATVVWYQHGAESRMLLHVPCFLFWGAALMWMIDAVFEYAELGAEYFAPAPLDMLNDAYLGLSVVALGLIIWLIVLLMRDPKGVVRSALLKK